MTLSARAVLAGLTSATALVALAAAQRPARPRSAGGTTPRERGNPIDAWTDALIAAVCRRARVATPRRSARASLRRAAVVATIVLVVAPQWVPAVIAAEWLRSRYGSARRSRAQRRAVAAALPDAVDLLLLCTSAGWSLSLSHPAVGPLVPAPLGDVLRSAADDADGGRPRAEALLDALAPLGDRAHSLGHVLADHLRYGTPLTPALERLGSELRLDRRRQSEEDARRVPVRLLAPLVACVLPAFALLTVVPLLAASLRALPT